MGVVPGRHWATALSDREHLVRIPEHSCPHRLGNSDKYFGSPKSQMGGVD